ncbi:MAG: RluA family pseudouridine synthase [Myxococcota bacterium]
MSQSAVNPVVLVVSSEEVRERIDRLLADRGIASRSTLARWIDGGRVTVQGRVVCKDYRVQLGDQVKVVPAPPEPTAATPQPLPLQILYEDRDILVVDKAAGRVVHPAPGHPEGTLVNAILFHCPDLQTKNGDPIRPGIVHRLDKDTSGVMVVAKSLDARAGLAETFAAHDLVRVYTAVVWGRPSDGTFDTLHGRSPSNRKKFSTRVLRGKRAVTHVRVKEPLGLASVVECRLETGRTHQIRVHLSDGGYPIVGDRTYGRPPKDGALRAVDAQLGRQALHAGTLGFTHPCTGAALCFESPLPKDIEQVIETLSERA